MAQGRRQAVVVSPSTEFVPSEAGGLRTGLVEPSGHRFHNKEPPSWTKEAALCNGISMSSRCGDWALLELDWTWTPSSMSQQILPFALITSHIWSRSLGFDDSVEKCRAVGQAFTMKHRSPELVRVVPTMVSICKLEGPQQVGDSHRRGVFQQGLRYVGFDTLTLLSPSHYLTSARSPKI